MDNKTISAIEFKQEFETQYGKMYKFMYTFDDSTSGEVNHKTNAPRFKAGDKVAVTKTGDHNGIAKLKVQTPESAEYGGTVTTNSPSRGGGRDQNVIGTQWAINAAVNWIQFQTQDPSKETLNHVAYYARELMKMRDNIESYKIDTTKPTDLPF